MIRITNAQYADFARELRACAEQVPDGCAIRYEKNGLTFNGVAYRNPEGKVRDIVPLWWEYKTWGVPATPIYYPPDSDPAPECEVSNDFQWSELYKHFGFV